MPCAPGKPCIGDDAKAIVLDFLNPVRARPAAALLAAGGRARIGEGTGRRERGAAAHSLTHKIMAEPSESSLSTKTNPQNSRRWGSRLSTWLTSLLADLALGLGHGGARSAVTSIHSPRLCSMR
jgi:hypothetical protein